MARGRLAGRIAGGARVSAWDDSAVAREAAVSAGLVAGIALAVVLAVIFRIEVVKLWPGAATAYAAIGMPANASGLLIDEVQAAPAIAMRKVQYGPW